MNATNGPLVAWPGWRHLLLTLKLASRVVLTFCVCYVGADWLTSQHAYRVHWNFEFERNMPFFPPAVLVYLSLNLMLWLSPLVLRARREIAALAATMVVVTIVAGCCFLLFPARQLYEPTNDSGRWSNLVSLAKQLALTNNFVPSLHVTYATICVGTFSRRASRGQRFAMAVWLSCLAASTLLLHQHYLVDVASGFALGYCGLRFGYNRWVAAEV